LREKNPVLIALELSKYCSTLLKGGHNPFAVGIDYLYTGNEIFRLAPNSTLASENMAPAAYYHPLLQPI
jgi:hydroxymethylpyrimidine/phosphomethylpyrimidine kinase